MGTGEDHIMKINLEPAFIEQSWPLSNVELHEVYRAVPRIVRRISSDQGDYVIKAADPSKDKEAIERDTATFDFLESKQFPAPRLLHATDNQKYVYQDGRFWYVLAYINGNANIEGTPQNWRAIGRLMGRLHSLDGYTQASDFTCNSEITRMLKRAAKYNIGEEYIKLVRNLPDLSNLSQAFIHTDIGKGNVIQQKDGNLVLVDWDDAGLGTRILDVGFPLICAFVKDNTFEAENAKAFYQGYVSKVTLNAEEQAHLFDAALFFILSYSIFDGFGVHQENWQKAQFAVAHRKEIETIMGKI